MSADIKLSKAHLSKIIQSDGFFGSMIENLSKMFRLNLQLKQLCR